MRAILLGVTAFLSLLPAGGPVHAQVPAPDLQDEAEADPDVLAVAEVMPELLDGFEGLRTRLRYPIAAVEAGIEGRVFVQFIVDEHGLPTDIHVVRGIGGGCDEAAVEAIQESRFRPGTQQGHPVKVRMALPVSFRLTRPPPRPTVVPPVVFAPPIQENDQDEDQGSKVYEVVDQLPVLLDGIEALQARLRYPERARRAGIEGRVFVQFVVDEMGTPTDIRVVRGIGGGCDEAAVEAVRQSQFTPGLLDGRTVKVRMSLPVTFRLI